MQRFYFLSILISLFAGQLAAQVFDERFDIWPTDLKTSGTICFGESASIEQLKSILGDESPRKVVLLTHATGNAKELITNQCTELNKTLFVCTPSEWADASDKTADVCIWYEESETHENHSQRGSAFRAALEEHLERGKLLIAIGHAAKQLSQYYSTGVTHRMPQISDGFNLLPNCVVETRYPADRSGQPQMLSILTAHPRCVGIGLESGTMAILRGRKIRVLGKGSANFLLAANERVPIRSHSIAESSSSGRDLERSLVDLTEWRRDAIDRTLEAFPPPHTEKPHLDSGTLVIVGGGGMPQGLMSQFVEAAGGIENAKLVYVPCDENDLVSPNSGMMSSWSKMGVHHTAMLHTKNRVQANEDEAFLKPLTEATGIWFGGGRQWNLADSYYGTKAHRLMKEMLRRGGVVGGSSAGASIQAAYLARATPIENFRIMAPGYERGGLGFLRGVAIDQHFTQRMRQPDMTQLVNRYPQLLGIGIDESTAIVVKGSIATVHGNGKVHFYDRTKPVYPDQPDFLALVDGQRYDLAERKHVEE